MKLLFEKNRKVFLLVIALILLLVCSLTIFILTVNNKQKILVAEVDNTKIYLSDINLVFEDIKQYKSFDSPESEQAYRKYILENGINEIIVVNEGLQRGITVNDGEINSMIASLQQTQPNIYNRIIQTYGLKRYKEDLKKRHIYNEMKIIILDDGNYEISDEDLYIWYSGLDNVTQMNFNEFENNIDSIKEEWVEYEQDIVFSEWLSEIRKTHEIIYINEDLI